jgi:hypothetical protein
MAVRVIRCRWQGLAGPIDDLIPVTFPGFLLPSQALQYKRPDPKQGSAPAVNEKFKTT